jgi:uncharacterized alpha-E superfamily protein
MVGRAAIDRRIRDVSQRYRTITSARRVNLVVIESAFPRAILNCIERAKDSPHAISESPLGSFRNQAEKRMGQLLCDLAYGRVEEILKSGLHEFVDTFQAKVNAVGSVIRETFAIIPAERATPSLI